jgi:hypothetical protein
VGGNGVKIGVKEVGLFKKQPISRILNHVGTLLSASGAKVESKGQSLRFRGLVGETRIDATPSGRKTPNGREVAETVLIQSDLNMPTLPWTDDVQCALNMSASKGALFFEDGGKFRIKSRVSLYSGDSEESVKVYTGITFLVAMIHTNALQAAIVDMLRLPVAKGSMPPESQNGSGWKPTSISRAASMLTESGAFALDDPTGLTAEFAWDPGAISALSSLISGSRQCTTRLQIQFEEHPSLGKGLLCRLDLPLHLMDAEVFRLAAGLNQMEFTAENWPPFLGAWTSMPKSGYPTFVSFWPSLFANVIDVEMIAMWMAARARLLPGWLRDNQGVQH